MPDVVEPKNWVQKPKVAGKQSQISENDCHVNSQNAISAIPSPNFMSPGDPLLLILANKVIPKSYDMVGFIYLLENSFGQFYRLELRQKAIFRF